MSTSTVGAVSWGMAVCGDSPVSPSAPSPAPVPTWLQLLPHRGCLGSPPGSEGCCPSAKPWHEAHRLGTR